MGACKFYCLLGVIERDRNMGIINLHFHFSQSHPETEKKPFKHRFERKSHYSIRVFSWTHSLSHSTHLQSLSQTNSTLTLKSVRTLSEMKYEIQVNIEPKVIFASINQFCLILLNIEKNTQIAAIHPLVDIDSAVADPSIWFPRLYLHLYQTS